MLTISEIIARTALERNETRVAHYRSDCPEENNRDWLKNTVVCLRDGQITLSTTPVDLIEMLP
jgi:succinate dehydrogenase / fumarate reductase flavoprotein subunit